MNRLQEYRAAAGLTQPQVAAGLKAVEARADAPLVSRYEKGVCLPTAAQLDRLEELLGAGRLELYDLEDLSLVGPPGELGGHPGGTGSRPEHAARKRSDGLSAESPRVRKCYRVPREFAKSLPGDLLEVCGYSSWNSWHDAALKGLLDEYAGKKGRRVK